jgi:hypothetical protein
MVGKQQHGSVTLDIRPLNGNKGRDGKLGMVVQKASHDLLILLSQEGTRRIEEPATRPDKRGVPLKNPPLGTCETSDILLSETELGAGIAAKRPDPGTGGVNQNSVSLSTELVDRRTLTLGSQNQGH